MKRTKFSVFLTTPQPEHSEKQVFPRSGYSSNILSGLSDLLFPSKLGKAPQSAQRLLSELLSGDGEIRTLDPLLARQVLSQLSYTPIWVNLIFNLPVGLNNLYSFKPMGLSGLEPPTSRLSGVRSNQLSYKPILKSFDFSGDEEIRTLDPLLARQVLSQLSYIPI